MLGERLAEIRKNYHDTQKSLADKLGLTVWAVSAWEQGRNSPPSDVLLAICKLYGTSADYLLGLTDIDPSDEARKQRQRLTEEEQNEMHRYEEYLLWKRKKEAAQRDRKVAGRLFSIRNQEMLLTQSNLKISQRYSLALRNNLIRVQYEDCG